MRLHSSIGGYGDRTTARFRQSIHFNITQVLFADHVHWRTGVDNKFSFLKLRVYAGRHLFSEGEKNVALSCSFKFNTLLGSFHAASRARCSCHSVSSWDRSSNFGALGLRWWSSPGQTYPSDGFWSRMLAWRTTALVNRTHRIGFSMFELFRKIDEDFCGSISWNTQPKLSCTFQQNPCNLVTILSGPFAKLFVNLTMCIRALSPNLQPLLAV